VRCTWKGDIHAKEQLIISRQKQIEQLWQFEEEEKIREKSMLVGKISIFNNLEVNFVVTKSR